MAAFLWVCNHGDHVEYRAAGSTRQSDVHIPYGYLLAWEMIQWAKGEGAEWFDMGGVTMAEEDRPELQDLQVQTVLQSRCCGGGRRVGAGTVSGTGTNLHTDIEWRIARSRIDEEGG